jgi:aminoglycoside phosphotransferase family enzyme
MRVELKIDFDDLIDDFDANNDEIAFLMMNLETK